ncbi:RDD family protein [Campylobacter blaseri]|uniref:RDD domain-containing protein n=1 Tax=Campylobacter blaseri TaxID=2042961 RepID=A0A2P8R0C2_9BACT|nr:RDD family protein [Campylobacter blaseri]PSM51947.1 hypothetical protein CQ405_05115 [Campylobacter blaseri]PSM53731.1 hypothetical protein CRN67_05115 [Campylobacter blaseri]QKF85714.1 RDD family protein [Campylobacter blaseri]
MNYEDVKLASFNKRVGAFLIDEIILSILFIIAFYDKFSNITSQEEVIQILGTFTIYFVFVKVAYQAIFVNYYGATVGKLIFKIKCINLNGEIPNFLTSLNRAMVRIFISETLFYIGYIWAYFNPVRQTWHDKLAKTLVIDVS